MNTEFYRLSASQLVCLIPKAICAQLNMLIPQDIIIHQSSHQKKKKHTKKKKKKKTVGQETCCNAPVICNHGPPGPGNSRDFDFWSSKSLLKAPPCGDCSLVKVERKTTAVFPHSLLAIFSFHCPFCLYKANPGYFASTAMATLWSKPRSFPRLSPTLPRAWGPWLQMTSA